jgi:plasmid maintenance system antidote protein VapI
MKVALFIFCKRSKKHNHPIGVLMSQNKKTIQTAKNLVIASTIAFSSLFLQSCSEEDVDRAITVLAVAAILASPDVEVERSRPPLYNECYDRHSGQYCDSLSRPDQQRHFSVKSTSNLQFSGAMINMSVPKKIEISKPAELSTHDKIMVMSAKYKITESAAEKLQSALDKATQRDFAGIDEIGILRKDVQSIYENKKVTRYTIVNLSASLGITFDEAKAFVSHLQSDLQQAKLQL